MTLRYSIKALPFLVLFAALTLVYSFVSPLAQQADPDAGPAQPATAAPSVGQPDAGNSATTTQPVDPFTEAAKTVDALLLENNLEEAATAARALLARREIELGADHPSVADSLLQLAEVQLRQQAFADAEHSLLRALDLRSRLHGDDHASLIEVWRGMARSFHGREQIDDAHQALVAALDVSLKSHGSDHATTTAVRLQLAVVLMQMKQHSAAQKELTTAGRWLEKHGSTSERRAGYTQIANFYAQTGDRAQEALWRGRLQTLPDTE